jgi:hypothetical protein
MRPVISALVLVAACGGDPYEGWPDLRGRYNIQITRTEGCANAPEHVSWTAGGLAISGELPDLTFALGTREGFTGTSTESGGFSFRGSAEGLGGVQYQASGSGRSSGAPPNYLLEGSIDVTVVDADDNCVYTAVFRAPQVGS